MDSARTDILVRYGKFLTSLKNSPSKEVAMMANLVSRDVRTTTGANLKLIQEASGLPIWGTSQEKLREALRVEEAVMVLKCDKWRVPYLSKLLEHCQELYYRGEDVKENDDLINSLCIN